MRTPPRSLLDAIPPLDPNLERLGPFQWRNGTTWHAAEWRSSEQVLVSVECFEIAWDADGIPSVTGRRAPGYVSTCLDTERAPYAEAS